MEEVLTLAETFRMEWEEFYKEEIVNNVFYKTFYFSYGNRYFQFEPLGRFAGKRWDGYLIKDETYVFSEVLNLSKDKFACTRYTFYDSFKDAVDNQVIIDGKKLKDLWYDIKAQYIDFL